MILLPPGSALFPYTTLFRSMAKQQGSSLGFKLKVLLVLVVLALGGWTAAAVLRGAPDPAVEVTTTLPAIGRSEEHTSELQSRLHLVCRLLLEKKNSMCEESS